MNNITFNGVSIQVRDFDGYWNATQLCQEYGKLFADFFRLKLISAYTKSLSVDLGVSLESLIEVSPGRNSQTWVHPSVGEKLVEWLGRPKSDQKEGKFRDYVAQELGGQTEVKTPAGFIDVLTKNMVIEVKAIKLWKAAIGQVFVYQTFYPRRKPAIALFDYQTSSIPTSLVDEVCKKLGIKVYWLD